MASTLTVDNIVGATSSSNIHIPGHVINVVSTKFESVFSFSSSSFTNISASGQSLSATLTPVSTSSKVLIICNIPIVGNDTSSGIGFGLTRNGTLVGQGTSGTTQNTIATKYNPISGSNDYGGTNFSFLDSPSTTSSVTYQVQALASAGTTVYVNRRYSDTYFGAPSVITLMEVAQ
jgi:hypothetical protein